MSKTLSPEVKADLVAFLDRLVPSLVKEIKWSGQSEGIDLTVATDDNGQTWNYQTGDNSFTGGAYGLPHWAVTTIFEDSDPMQVYEEIVNQLEDLINQ